MEWTRGTELKVGLFVLAAVVLGIVIVVLVGTERQLFEDEHVFKTSFEDANGLKKGTSVRIGGINAGTVKSVRISENPRSRRVVVQFSVAERYRDRVRTDSIARVGDRGLLGDKNLDVSVGTPDSSLVPDWGWIRSGSAKGMMQSASAAVERAEKALEQAQKVLSIFTNEEMIRDIQGTAHNLREITDAINRGDGAVHRLLHDPEMAENLDGALSGLSVSSRRLASATGEMEHIMREVRTGRGALHALIYEPDGAQALAQVGRAADELATLSHDIRTENGLLHSLIYTDEQANLLANLTETSAGVRQIVADLRAGRGTIGALLVDPSVYEDLKRVVGNVGRSRALRALVRYSITEDERRPGPPQVQRPEQDGNGQSPP